MSSFTEYHKKWKEENGRTEDSQYKQRNISEIQKSTEQYVNSMFGKQGKIWEKIQNTANNNLNRTNNMQNLLDRNTRNQMAQNMEDFTNRKRTAMQSVSNAIQENAKKREEAKQENKALIDQANDQFRQQHPSTVNTNQKQEYELPKAKVELADNNNLKDLKVLQSGDMFKLTDGAVDDRNNFQKTVDSVSGIGGNLLIGLESVVPSMGKYIITGGEVATGKAINSGLEKIFGTEQDLSKISENLGEQVFDKVVEESTLISKEKMQEEERWRKETIANNIKKTDTPLGKKIAEIVPSVGQNIIPMAISYFNPVAGTALFMSSAAGNYLDEAEERGMNKEQALTYATVMGSFEGATEQVISGKMLSNSMKIFNGVGLSEEVLNSFGVSTAENFLQEAIMEPLQEATAETIGGKDKANWDNIMQRSLEAGVDGVLSSILLNGASVGIASANNVLNKKNPTQKEIQVALEDTINSKKVDVKSIIEGAKEGIAKSQTNNYKDYNTNQPLDSVSQQWLNRANDIINENSNSNLQQNTTNNPISPLMQQTNSQENKMDQNGNMEQIKNSKLEEQQKPQRLQELKNIDTSEMGLLERSKIKNEIKTLEQGYNSVEEYRKAERLKVEKAKQEYKQKQDNKTIENIENSNYQMQHRPTQNGIGYDITSEESIGKDFYTNPENYIDMSRTYNQESYQAIKSIQGNPEAEITVYRASPVNELNNGDWISLSKEYATMEAQKENVQVNEFTVKAKDIQWAGDDINEFGYFPTTLANNGQTVYNNNTESEGGINGREEVRQSNRDVFEQSTNEINTEGQTTINAREGFEKRFREATRKRISEEEISENSKNNRKILKDVYDTDIFFIEDNLEFSGGADEKLNLINLTREIANSRDNNVATGHELFEVIRNTKEDIKDEYIEPLIDIVKNDNNFNEVLRKYVDNCETKDKQLLLDNPRYIAKEILFDEAGFMFNEDEFNLGVQKQETNLIRFSDYLDTSKAVLQMGLSNIEQKARKNNKITTNENMQEQTNTTNQLKKVETNTQSLGYKPDTEGKQRKHYKSVMESDQVGEVGKQSAKSLLENDVYKPLSNIDTLATANEKINRNGVDSTYIAFRNKLNSNERITLQDIATGERLIQIFSQNGDFEKVNGLIQDVAMLGTELGQQVQAMSLIKKASPEGQLMYLQKVVERTNIKENTDLKVTEEMSKKILETKNETELENVMTDIAVELGEQLPVTMGDKVRSWRYLSMLGNPKTHIKNLGANVAMNVTQQLKNKVAGATEDIVGMFNKDMEKTKTLRPANQDQRNFAKQDAEFMKDKIDGGGKYDIKNAIQSNKRQFDNRALNAIANFNSNMLELEDNIFLKKAYQQSMQNYMSANKLSSSDMQNSSVLQKAREYASYQAQEATFHQFSALAQRLTEIENKGGIAGKVLEAVVPFKKTPINIAKSGVEYSPIGLVKSLSYDLAQLNKKTKDYKAKLEKGIISEADYKAGTSKLVTKTIDNVAKGLTGTSLAILGYALADTGLLKSGNDGDDDEFKEQLGEQEYAIRIGDNTYTLDWVSPSAIPMFMGATVHDLMHSENEDNSNTLNSLMTSSAKALEPMTEMSMLQGLTSAISSYEQGSSNMLFDLGASAVSSYLGQFVPTALGQVAKTIDDKERDTSSTEKGLAKKVDQFKKQQLAKIPIASKSLPARKDVWGNEKTRDSNPLVRAYEVGLAPYNKKKVVEDYTEKELLKVFEDTGEKSVLPGIPNKDITINKQKYRLTAEEYNKAKETFGKTSKSMLDSLVKTNEYKQLSDEQKASAIDNIYSYAKEKIKVNYAKGKKQEVETSSSYNILNELKNPTNQSEYLSYSAKIQGIEKDTEKKKILADGKYSTTTKETIYKNTLGKEDDLYNNILSKDNININEYLNYKLQKFESDKEDDGTVKGKSIKGSRPKKLYDYVNNMNITRNQKLAIIGSQCKLDRNEQRELYNYINNIPGQTQKKKLEMFSKYSSNFIVNKDNTINLNYK